MKTYDFNQDAQPAVVSDILKANQLPIISAQIRKRKTHVLPQVRCSADTYRVVRNQFSQPDLFEEIIVVLLNRRAECIGVYHHSRGGMSGTVADAKLIFSVAISAGASSIVLVHNHPSGNPNPSQADIAMTEKFAKAGELLDVFVLDHLILAGDTYYSFADEGRMS